MKTCLIVDGSPMRLGTGTGLARLPLACLTSVPASPQPFWAKTVGVWSSLIAASEGSVKRVSEAVVPCVP